MKDENKDALPSSSGDAQKIAERTRRQNSRNWAVFSALLLFVALVYGVTIIKIKLGYGP